MNRFLLFGLFVFAGYLQASTFIGNGGDTGDFDISITLAEISKTAAKIDDFSQLCECSGRFKNNTLCDVLSELNKTQVEMCAETLYKNRDILSQLSSPKSPIKFKWSNDSISVPTAQGPRVVDAVSRSDKQEIVIDRERFLKMNESYRVALLTHELFHLIKIDGEYIVDDQKVNLYKDGKNFLDVLGIALAAEANDSKVIRGFVMLRHLSRSTRKNIFEANLKSISSFDNKNNHKLLKDKTKDASGAAFSYEYKPQSLGFRMGLEKDRYSSQYKAGVDVKENMTLYSLGVGYHWNPIHRNLSWIQELQIAAFIDALYGRSTYQISDSAVTLGDNSAVGGTQLIGQLRIPFLWGFWLNLGHQTRYLHYNYDKLGILINDYSQSFFLGGAYAF